MMRCDVRAALCTTLHAVEEAAEDPAASPIYWVSKWVDYSDKYGIGYQLSDNSIGVLFNDSTRLLPVSYTHLTLPTNREV